MAARLQKGIYKRNTTLRVQMWLILYRVPRVYFSEKRGVARFFARIGGFFSQKRNCSHFGNTLFNIIRYDNHNVKI